MILFTILTITLILLIVFTVIVVSITGAVGIVIFGDVIVCAAIIIWLIRHFAKNE